MEEVRHRLVHDLLCDFDESLARLFFIRVYRWDQRMLSYGLGRTTRLRNYMRCCDVHIDSDQQEGVES